MTNKWSESGKAQFIERALMIDAAFRENSLHVVNGRLKGYVIRLTMTMRYAKENLSCVMR